MNKGLILLIAVLMCSPVFAQADLDKLVETDSAFDRLASQRGTRTAFLQYLSDDATLFRPDPINGKQYWKDRKDNPNERMVRSVTFGDISANGILGYTTGNWRIDQKGKDDSYSKFGQYVTIWEKRKDGKYYATVDIGITHEKLPPAETNKIMLVDKDPDLNKRAWSPADSSMDFFRTGMEGQGLADAYEKYAAKDARLLIEQLPPIVGRKKVIKAMEHYKSVEFPQKVAMYQAADMAYVWNPCQYANSNEGIEKGNCLHIWKLRDNKWWVVLGVFAPQPNETIPTIRLKPGKKKT
jgi:ketosteroid isomerase-like protein